MTKNELQEKAYSYFTKYKNIILEWATGVGKTNVAINYMKQLNKGKVLICVAEIAHKDNWCKEVEKWGGLPDSLEIVYECYASLKKHENTSWDMVVYDEAHHINSDLRLSILNTLHSLHNIFLSATLDKDSILHIREIFGSFYLSKVSLKDAVSLNIIPKADVYTILFNLSDISTKTTLIKEWGKKEERKTLHCKFEDIGKFDKRIPTKLIIECSYQDKYDYINRQIDYYKRLYLDFGYNDLFKLRWFMKGSERKRFLGEAKTELAKQIINILKDKRFVCFCVSKKQAETLGSKNSIYSGKKDVKNTIKDFNDKKINHLFVVNMLQEGENLTDVEAGIFIQLDGKERLYIQKSGRTLRFKDPKQYIILFNNTKDMDYFDNVVFNNITGNINVINGINELNDKN